MSWFTNYLKSSVGAKHLMAITGIALVGFVIAHMLGNLLVFAGQDALNSYAQGLQDTGGLLWVARAGLLVAVAAHIAAAVRLTALNKAARPVGYVRYKPIRSPFYARVMPWTGLLLFLFIVFHLLHFTFGVVLPDAYHQVDALGRHDVYSMVVRGFQQPVVALSYVIAMVFLCMHLAHGVRSMFQSLGINHPKYNPLISKLGPAIAIIVFIGDVSMPLAVLGGFITLPGA